MKWITAFTLLAIANFAMAGTSFAQYQGVRADVPFGFTVSDKLLPAGTYTIKKNPGGIIAITNHDKPIAVFSLVSPDSSKSANGGILVFHRYGDQYFLSEILCQSAGMSLQVPQSKTEKTTAVQQARLSGRNQTIVAAR